MFSVVILSGKKRSMLTFLYTVQNTSHLAVFLVFTHVIKSCVRDIIIVVF